MLLFSPWACELGAAAPALPPAALLSARQGPGRLSRRLNLPGRVLKAALWTGPPPLPSPFFQLLTVYSL